MLSRADNPPPPRPGYPWRPPPLAIASLLWHLLVLGVLAADLRLWPEGLLAILANHVVLCIPGVYPHSQVFGPSWRRLPSLGRGDEVALTFDDGPDPEVTPRVLEQLAAAGARASFFLIGERAAAHPELVGQIVAAGHRVENHTQHHRYTFAFNVYPYLKREIETAQRVLGEIAGRPPAWFRAPAGIHNLFLSAVLSRLGLFFVSWTRRGYDTVEKDAAKVLDRLKGGLAPGDILLLHDGNAARTPDDRPVVLEVLPPLLAELARRRLRAVPLPEPRFSASRGIELNWDC
jgi:peptidoglycan/xylan/chitin deacetylase (PgdA/CDA1 family)